MKAELKRLAAELIDSVIMGDFARVRELVREGVDVNAKDVEHEETPLILAVKFAGVDVVRLLLEAGAEVDTRDGWGRTALFYATVSSEVFGALLEAGADVHAQDKEGNTILMRKVSECASVAEVEELLKLGVDSSFPNEIEDSALDLAEGLGLVKLAERLRSWVG